MLHEPEPAGSFRPSPIARFIAPPRFTVPPHFTVPSRADQASALRQRQPSESIAIATRPGNQCTTRPSPEPSKKHTKATAHSRVLFVTIS
ncbi:MULTISPECIES: hypothetical protein [Acidiphilium]|uniref:Uncharacterized protein n=1 Tax=Acidiphilium rubrum TaxID=526 RepID=A0A8G2CMY2_ACIRU|nr:MULTISPECIES: hypothetical protein [Acidiphilium]SIR33441.1 hypothetical protein SAMN05421828_12514 [Acidiphilium rubrum]